MSLVECKKNGEQWFKKDTPTLNEGRDTDMYVYEENLTKKPNSYLWRKGIEINIIIGWKESVYMQNFGCVYNLGVYVCKICLKGWVNMFAQATNSPWSVNSYISVYFSCEIGASHKKCVQTILYILLFAIIFLNVRRIPVFPSQQTYRPTGLHPQVDVLYCISCKL